jgi:hypothetical protein
LDFLNKKFKVVDLKTSWISFFLNFFLKNWQLVKISQKRIFLFLKRERQASYASSWRWNFTILTSLGAPTRKQGGVSQCGVAIYLKKNILRQKNNY